MRAFFFCEQPYPQAWDADPNSLRVTLPSRHFDPVRGADLLNRYYDDYLAADELGFDIMLNEHHSTPTCLQISCHLTLAVLARITKRARLLTLGIPGANRPDPLRIAEEIAYADCLSRGRVEMGFVKGVPYELASQNSNPVYMTERLNEAIDFVVKAMTTHDGPFSWEGKHFHYRNVSMWPRPYQQPHPPIWMSVGSAANAIPVAERGYNIATVLNRDNAAAMFANYRRRCAELGRALPGPERFGYLGLLAVGATRAEAFDRLGRVKGYLDSATIVAPGFSNPPGYVPAEVNAKALAQGLKTGRAGAEHLRATLRDGRTVNPSKATPEELVETGLAFAGTPDEVAAQITDLHDKVGGLGNLILLAQGGFSTHEDTVRSLSLFSAEVMPRIQELRAPEDARRAALEKLRDRAAAG